MKIQKRLLDSLKYDQDLVARKLRTVEQFPLELIQEAFPEGFWSMCYDGASFNLPYNFEYISLVKEFMEIQFPEKQFKRETPIIWEQYNQAGYYIEYRWDDRIELQFRLNTENRGTTCVLQKIGETQKTIPIFEVTCSEGATEKW